MKKFSYLFFVVISYLLIAVDSFAMTEMKKFPDDDLDSVGTMGFTAKYKRVAGPLGFGGDTMLGGLRAFTGKTRKSKFGVSASVGSLNGKSLKLNLKMGGLTYEDSFKTDPRLSWRFTLGGGSYELKSIVSGRVFNKGDFTYFEPMIFGVIHMNRHFRLQLGGGYTLANTVGVRMEGPCVQAEFLVGRY